MREWNFHSRSQKLGMEFSCSRSQKLGMKFFIPVPVPKIWEWAEPFPFPFPNDQKSFPLTPGYIWEHFSILSRIREAFKSNFWKNLGIWPNQVDPPPSPKVGTPKTKKKLMFILHFRLFWAFYFFVKIFIFFGWDDELGANTIMNWWNIVPPVMYYVFHHISGHLS